MANYLAFLNQVTWSDTALHYVTQNALAGWYNDMGEGISNNALIDHVKLWHKVIVDHWAATNLCGARRAHIWYMTHDNYDFSLSSHGSSAPHIGGQIDPMERNHITVLFKDSHGDNITHSYITVEGETKTTSKYHVPTE